MGRWIHDHGKIKIESNFQHFTESCCASIQCHEFLLSPNFCNFINFTWNHLRWDKFFAQNHDKLGKSLFMDFIFHANAEKWNQVNAQFTEILVTTVVYILKMLLKLQKSLILRVLAKILDIFGPNMTHFKKTLCVCVLLSESESNLSHKGKFRDPTISRKNPHEPMAKTVTLPAIEMICIRRCVGRSITWFYSYDCKKVPHLKNWCHRRSIQLFSNHIQ